MLIFENMGVSKNPSASRFSTVMAYNFVVIHKQFSFFQSDCAEYNFSKLLLLVTKSFFYLKKQYFYSGTFVYLHSIFSLQYFRVLLPRGSYRHDEIS